MNNPYTSPVEEDSNYLITVKAVNSVTESNPSNTAFTTTAETGEITIHVFLIVETIKKCLPHSSWVSSISQCKFS